VRLRVLLSGAGVTFAALFAAAPAGAAFHLIKVSEVHPGTVGNPDGAFIELQMVAAGQNAIAGHEVDVYASDGAVTATVPMPDNVANGANNATILLGDTSVTNADVPANIGTLVSPIGGAVCFPDAVPADCVAWGNFSAPGSLPSAVGTPAAPAGIPDGQSLTRSMASGCATLLESSDDTDDSAADFDLAAPSPRPNSAEPTETPCSTPVAPSTTIDKGPKKKTKKASARFRFSSNAAGASFECKLDKGPWEPCSSPRKYRVGRGKHVFRARATADGLTDATPATHRWKRKRKKR
jgi:hypothetical protein